MNWRGRSMVQINDDPILRTIEATGYPPQRNYKYWAFNDGGYEYEDDWGSDDVYYDNETDSY